MREGYTNVRVGMFLEIATTVGAVIGAYLASQVSTGFLGIVFGLVLLYSAWAANRPRPEHPAPTPDRLAVRLRFNSSYPTPAGPQSYLVQRVPFGFGLMFLAGTLSGLLGIGSGAVKVLAMDQAMGLPFKVSTTTSNFMIGVTAAASAGVYLQRGYIDPGIAMPVMLGVLAGATFGATLLARARPGLLRLVFGAVVFVLALEMIYHGATGRI
jgi:uncharacterized membrane protein YfcA